jgi:hypothetical protein
VVICELWRLTAPQLLVVRVVCISGQKKNSPSQNPSKLTNYTRENIRMDIRETGWDIMD